MIGLESTVSVGKQASTANPSTQARQLLNVYKIDGGQTANDETDNLLGGNLTNTEDPVFPAPGLDDHRITLEVPLCNTQFGWWLAAYFGTEVASGTNPNYTHAWTSGGALPNMFIEHQAKSGRFRRHFCCVGESMEIDLDAERSGFAMGKFTFVGLSETSATAALTGTVTAAPALDRPAQKLVNVTYNSIAGGDLIGGKFSHKRTLKRIRSADGTGLPYVVELDAVSEISGEIRTRFHDDTFADDGIASTTRALGLYLMTNATRGIKFDFAAARLARTPLTIDGPGGVEYSPSFKAWQTSGAAAMIARTLNSQATMVYP
jgi:hypothetical protein